MEGNTRGKRFAWLREEVVGSAAYDLVLLILGSIFSSGGFALISKVIVSAWETVSPYESLVAWTAGSAGAFLFVLGFRRFRRYRPNYPAIVFDFNYRILEREITHQYVNANTLIHKRRLHLKSRKPNLNEYLDKYHWSGSKEPLEIKSTIDKHEFKEIRRKNVWNLYKVVFERHLRKGETKEIEVVFKCEDIGDAVPFFSATVEEPTDKLIFNLILPVEWGVEEAIWETSSGIGATEPIDSGVIKFDRTGTAKWTLTKPRMLHYYEMRWVYPTNFLNR